MEGQSLLITRPLQAKKCKHVFNTVIQGRRNILGMSGGPYHSIFYNSMISMTVVWKSSWCQASQTAGEERIWIPIILFPRIESKAQSRSDSEICGCWGVCVDEATTGEISRNLNLSTLHMLQEASKAIDISLAKVRLWWYIEMEVWNCHFCWVRAAMNCSVLSARLWFNSCCTYSRTESLFSVHT